MLLSIIELIIPLMGDVLKPFPDLTVLEDLLFPQELLFFQPEYLPVLGIAATWFIVLGIMCYNLEKIPGKESNKRTLLHR